MFSTISKLFMFCLLFSRVSGISLLEKLLETHIKEAQCQVRCQGQENQEDVRMCLEVCRIVVKNPESSICQLPHLCAGVCQAACQDDGVKAYRITSMIQDDCQLSWSLESGVKDDLLYIISGVDLGGKINLISSGVKDTSLKITPSMTEKYLEMSVIAVGSQGVLDVQSSIIITQDKCEKPKETNDSNKIKTITQDIADDKVIVKKITNNQNFLQIIIYNFLATLFLVVIVFIICIPRKSKFDKLEIAPEWV